MLNIEGVNSPSFRIDGVNSPSFRIDGVNPPSFRIDEVNPPSFRIDEVNPPSFRIDEVNPPSFRIDEVVSGIHTAFSRAAIAEASLVFNAHWIPDARYARSGMTISGSATQGFIANLSKA